MPDGEIEVAGEAWTGLVVVADSEKAGPGRYGLVQAVEWCRHPEKVTVWRGPEKPDETVPIRGLSEVTCRTILVDENGFYTCILDKEKRYYPCPEITEELREAVEKEAEALFDDEANIRAAESNSYVDEEVAHDSYHIPRDEDSVFAVSRFGDAVAVNGETVSENESDPPDGWEATDMRGRNPSGDEEEIHIEGLIEPLSRILTEKLKTRVDPWTVERILTELYGERGYVMWNSDSGESEVWISSKAMSRFEEIEEAQAKRKEEQELLKEKREERKRRAAERRLERERIRKIKKGGFPEAKDWSPRGKLPGER